jgi:hypothetical protein
MNRHLSLTAYGVFKARSLPHLKAEYSNLSTSGVYIWGICTDSSMVPLYVGVHKRNILKRVEEHFLNLHFGNKYRIFNSHFYDDLMLEQSLIPKTASISRINKDKHYAHYRRFFDDCIFQCDPIFLKEELKRVTRLDIPPYSFLMSLESKSITSQGYDYHFKAATGFAVQDTIDDYFSEDRFGFVLIPVGTEQSNTTGVDYAKLEGNIKAALHKGTLSDSCRYDAGTSIQLTANDPGSLDLQKLFHMKGSSILPFNNDTTIG